MQSIQQLWGKLRGMSGDEARHAFVDLVEEWPLAQHSVFDIKVRGIPPRVPPAVCAFVATGCRAAAPPPWCGVWWHTLTTSGVMPLPAAAIDVLGLAQRDVAPGRARFY